MISLRTGGMPINICFALHVQPGTAACSPAVVHVDGTAHVQIVGDNDDPFLKDLLRAFDELTGVPILLNTSFNRRGEPIVETPEDALDAFFGMHLDGLYMDRDLLRPSKCVSDPMNCIPHA